MQPYQRDLIGEIEEAVELWRLGVPNNVDPIEAELWFGRYDRAIETLTQSADPRYDTVAAELRAYRRSLQNQIDQSLRQTGDLE